MSEEEIDELRRALVYDAIVLFCPYGEVGRDAVRVRSVGAYLGDPKTGDDPEPGPVAWCQDGKYVALWNAGPEEFFVAAPLFTCERSEQ